MDEVLKELISDLKFGEIYELARGLMLSEEITIQDLIDYCFQEMDNRRDQLEKLP